MHTEAKTFDLRRPVAIPSPLVTRTSSDGTVLVIAPNQPSWIVLQDDLEVHAFSLIREERALHDVIRDLRDNHGEEGEAALRRVLIEISAQGFSVDVRPVRAGSTCNMTVYLTNRCNLRCTHCYRFLEKPSQELSSEKWFGVIQEFSELPESGGFLTVSAGEATVRKDLIELLQFASGLGLKCVLLTNGTRIDKHMASALVETCFEIQVSLDGFDSDTNDPVRGKGTFATIVSGLKALACARNSGSNRPRISLAVTPLPQHLGSIETGFPSFFRELNALFHGELLLRMTTDLKSGREFTGLGPTQQRDYRSRTRRLKSIVQNDPDWDDKIDADRFAPNVCVLNCGFGQNISVQPNGDVFGCYDAKDEFMGNVTTTPLLEIRAKLQALYSATCVQLSRECSSCDLRFICGGGCRLHNKRFRGDYLVPHCCHADPNWKRDIYDLMAKKRTWSWQENNKQKRGAQW